MCRRHKKGTQETEALGRSRGGFSTKLHARCDAKGRPLGFVLTPGQSHDIQGFGPLFRLIAHKIEALLADKGYDPAYGARPLKRVIQKELVDPIARKLLAGEIEDGGLIAVTASDDGLEIGKARVH